MSKLLDMFSQARRAQSSSGMGFTGRARTETKSRAAALVVHLPKVDAGAAESAIKAGADGLLFTWNGEQSANLDALKGVGESVRSDDKVTVTFGLAVTGGWEQLDATSLEKFKDQGINYVILPLDAPVRLLSKGVKDLEMVVTVPMREGDLYPTFIRNLTALNHITAVRMDFTDDIPLDEISIEQMLHYRAVREAVRFPALLDVPGDLSEQAAQALPALGIQALIIDGRNQANAERQIKAMREHLEQIFQDESDKSSLMQP